MFVGGLSRSCKDVLRKNSKAPSGEYHIRTGKGRQIKVYCEFGLDSGAYTFFHPTAYVYLTQADVNYVQKDKTKVLLRASLPNGKQSYGVASQLPAYASHPVKALLSSHSGYQGPQNTGNMGSPYLFIGFIPQSLASEMNTQGLTFNGAEINFQNCDANPNSYMSLFANYREIAASSYKTGDDWAGVCTTMLQKMKNPPSARHMSADWFMFTEIHWGGCGCYAQTFDAPAHAPLAMTIGLQ